MDILCGGVVDVTAWLRQLSEMERTKQRLGLSSSSTARPPPYRRGGGGALTLNWNQTGTLPYWEACGESWEDVSNEHWHTEPYAALSSLRSPLDASQGGELILLGRCAGNIQGNASPMGGGGSFMDKWKSKTSTVARDDYGTFEDGRRTRDPHASASTRQRSGRQR
jgi:hypothetical protein